MVAQHLYVFWSGAICRFGHFRHVGEKCPFPRTEARLIELALSQRLYRPFFCSLNPQEVSM